MGVAGKTQKRMKTKKHPSNLLPASSGWALLGMDRRRSVRSRVEHGRIKTTRHRIVSLGLLQLFLTLGEREREQEGEREEL